VSKISPFTRFTICNSSSKYYITVGNYWPQQRSSSGIIILMYLIIIFYNTIIAYRISRVQFMKYLSSISFINIYIVMVQVPIFLSIYYLLSNIYLNKMVVWDKLSRSFFVIRFFILDAGRNEKNIMIFTIMCHVCFNFLSIINFWGGINYKCTDFWFQHFSVWKINPIGTLGIIIGLQSSSKAKQKKNGNFSLIFFLEQLKNLKP